MASLLIPLKKRVGAGTEVPTPTNLAFAFLYGATAMNAGTEQNWPTVIDDRFLVALRLLAFLLLLLPGIASSAMQVPPVPLGTSSLAVHTIAIVVDYSRHGYCLQLIATQRLKQPQITVAIKTSRV